MPTWIVPVLWVLYAMLLAGIIGYCISDEGASRWKGIPRKDLERILDLVAPVIEDGVCLGCGGLATKFSPPYVAHKFACPEFDRFCEIRGILQI